MLSGGLDSTVSLAMAAEDHDIRAALFFDYGQVPAAREREAALSIAGRYGIGFEKIDIPWLGRVSGSGLVGKEESIPDYSSDEVAGSKAVWVENRNGIFVNAAAAFASALGCEAVITGFNMEEAATFPDNSPAFVEAVNRALEISVGSPVKVVSPTIGMDKMAIAAKGIDLGIPFELLWSCYRAGPVMCGRCESCFRLMRAVKGTPAESIVSFAPAAQG
jgi:7-cyano-7-deazaguanine synthase